MPANAARIKDPAPEVVSSEAGRPSTVPKRPGDIFWVGVGVVRTLRSGVISAAHSKERKRRGSASKLSLSFTTVLAGGTSMRQPRSDRTIQDSTT
ncbi:hypothetical protein VTL71DRAFT_6484 [Oculimacula yallundae]|uniref:Uncharacterized protein n=1 Tax=Oculimacula yallundae TaxID=86028 RepID=A0ABR4BX38_9HELO